MFLFAPFSRVALGWHGVHWGVLGLLVGVSRGCAAGHRPECLCHIPCRKTPLSCQCRTDKSVCATLGSASFSPAANLAPTDRSAVAIRGRSNVAQTLLSVPCGAAARNPGNTERKKEASPPPHSLP